MHNLLSLRKNQSTKLFHYMNALSRLNEGLKDEYVVENEQLCLFPDMMYDEEGEETLDRILEKIIAKIDGSIERYVLISFDIFKSIKIPYIEKILKFLGKYSFQYWLLSGMFFLNTSELQWILYIPKESFLILIWSFALLTPFAFLMSKISNKIITKIVK